MVKSLTFIGSVFRRQLQDHRQYSNGRVAFKSGDSTDAYITVCCLDASRMDASPELRFMDPDRQGLGKWLLSDELLVAKRLLSLTLLAWPLSNDDTPKLHSVRLYSHIRHISAHRLKVGFITDQNEVFVWRVGGNLIQIDVSDTMRSLIEPKTPVNPPSVLEACPIGVIFHPNGENHFFVFHLQLISEIIDHTSPDQIHVQVQEHGAGGQQNTFSKCLFDYNHDTSDAPFHDRSKLRVEFHLKISSCSRVCPIDTDGLCIIAWDTRSFVSNRPSFGRQIV
jgi:hypothetical protein